MRTLSIILLMILAALGLVIATQAQDAIGVDDMVTGSLSDSRTQYALTLAAGNSVVIELNSDDFNTLVVVLDSSDTEIGRDDDRGEGSNSRFYLMAREAATYTIVVRGLNGNATGDYSLSVTAFEAVPIALGSSTRVDFSAEVTTAYFSFEANAGDVVDIGANGLEQMDTHIILYNADGEVAYDASSGNGYNPLIESFVAPTTGVYIIVFEPEPVHVGETATPYLTVRPGELVSLDEGTVTLDLTVNNRDFAGFTATAGTTYRLTVVSTTGLSNPYIDITTISGDTVASARVESVTELAFTFTPDVDGRLRLEIADEGDNVLDITITPE